MSKNTLFQVAQLMYEDDVQQKTQNVKLFVDPTQVDDLKKHKKVTFTVPLDAFRNIDLLKGRKRIVMMVLDVEDFKQKDATSLTPNA